MEDTASMNHHFWGDISAWFVKRLAGICYNPDGTDRTRVDICPHFPEKMEDASAWYDSNCGKIASKWVREGNKIVLNLEIPANMQGQLILKDGCHLENGETTCPVVSGEYTILKY